MPPMQPSGPNHAESAEASSGEVHRSVGVTICAVLGILFVVCFESYHAVFHSVTWRDWGHLVAATGTICFLLSAAWKGRWGIRTRSANKRR